MVIQLEYIVCQHTIAEVSHAVKSHRVKNQNPGLEVTRKDGRYVWTLQGLARGTIEETDKKDPPKTRLDFYIGRAALLEQRFLLPRISVRGVSRRSPLRLTNPTGTERRAGKRISWKGPITKLGLDAAWMAFPSVPGRLLSDTDALFNIDWEPTPRYRLPDGSRTQLHFGVECQWKLRSDSRVKVPRAELIMTPAQYAYVYRVLNAIR